VPGISCRPPGEKFHAAGADLRRNRHIRQPSQRQNPEITTEFSFVRRGTGFAAGKFNRQAWALSCDNQRNQKMIRMNGCRLAAGMAAAIWLAQAASAQAGEIVIYDSSSSSSQVVDVSYRECPATMAALKARLVPLLKKLLVASHPGGATAASANSLVAVSASQIVLASSVRAARLSHPLVLGIAY